MSNKLDWVLLVDDDVDFNFFHQRIFNKMGCTHQIDVANDGQKALNILKTKTLATLPANGIILLDINMPGLNGWGFLEEYLKIDMNAEQHIVIIILTSSLNPDDKEKAFRYPCVNDFLNKLLTKDAVIDILNEHFPQVFNKVLPAA